MPAYPGYLVKVGNYLLSEPVSCVFACNTDEVDSRGLNDANPLSKKPVVTATSWSVEVDGNWLAEDFVLACAELRSGSLGYYYGSGTPISWYLSDSVLKQGDANLASFRATARADDKVHANLVWHGVGDFY